MERLDFTLPEFARYSWASDLAHSTWEPRFRRIGAAWAQIEWLSVVEGLRACALVTVSAEDFLKQGARWAGHGLCNLPVAMEAAANLPYCASSGGPRQPGQPFEFRLVLGRPADVVCFKEAWDAGDHEAMGAMLGYPACCTRFFHDTWVDEGLVDTTWPMALRSTRHTADQSHTLEVSGPSEANILWRWMGLRAVPHLPCSFECAETVFFGRSMIALARRAGYAEEMDWLSAVLDWPIEWSALHGIAEIKTPLLKVSTLTDATPVRYTVRRAGSGYPHEGGRGIGFPFNQAPPQDRVEANASEAASTPVRGRPAWYATDNDFGTVEAMEAAHRPLVELAQRALGLTGGAVLDLGCGNGALLAQLCEVAPQVVPYGLESRPERAVHAAELLPAWAANIGCGDMFTAHEVWPESRHYALVFLMPGRLIEAGGVRDAYLRERLASQSEHLLVYAYGDWLARYGGLEPLAAAAGITLVAAAPGATCALARLA